MPDKPPDVPFPDRCEAAKRLAERLKNHRGQNVLVVAVPRGAVTMAKEIADSLEGELDAMPTVANLEDRTVILVDDGILIGQSMLDTVQDLRNQKARRIIVATPVVSSRALSKLEREGADICSLVVRENFAQLTELGEFYDEFHSIDDAEIAHALSNSLRSLAELRNLRAEGPREIRFSAGGSPVSGVLDVPAGPQGLVILLEDHSRATTCACRSEVERVLKQSYLGVLRISLGDAYGDVEVLTQRMASLLDWVRSARQLSSIPVGVFTGGLEAAAVLQLASEGNTDIRALVLNRPETESVSSCLSRMSTPTLFVATGDDESSLIANRRAFQELGSEKRLQILPDAGLEYAEPEISQTVADLAASWFRKHLSRASQEHATQNLGAHAAR